MIGILNDATWLAVLAFCRIGACFLVLPGFSSSRVPTQTRLFVTLAISVSLMMAVWPQLSAAVTDNSLATYARLFVAESIIGLFMGLTVRFYVLALGFMANGVGMLMGFGTLTGPGFEETEPQAAIGTLMSMSVLLLLFILDFHHTVVTGLIASYSLFPVNASVDVEMLLMDLTDILKESFLLVLRLGSPFIAYALIMNLMIGILNKLTPQIPIYFVSLPIVIAGGLILLYFSIPSFLLLFIDGFSQLWILN